MNDKPRDGTHDVGRDGVGRHDVGRDLVAAAFPDRDEAWIDRNAPRVSDEARTISRGIRRRRRRARLGQLSASPTTRRTVALVRMSFVLAGILALLLGYLGLHDYLATSAYAHGVVDLLYYDLQLFVLGSDPLRDGAGPYPLPLEIARLAAPAVALFAVVEAVRLLLAQELRRLVVRQRRNHVVICGESALADALVAMETAAGSAVVVVAGDAFGYPGTIGIEGDARDPRTLIRAGASRARRLYAVDDDPAVNVAIVLGAAGLESSGRRVPPMFGSIADPDLLAALNARRLAAPAAYGAIFFNADELAARQLAVADVGQLARQVPAARIVVAGMTTFGRALVVELARRWEVGPHERRLRVTIVDRAASAAVRSLLGRFPFLEQVCEFDPHDEAAGLVRWAASTPVVDVVRTYICYTEPERALREAFLATGLWRGAESVLVRLDSFALFGIDFHGVATVFDDATAAVRPFGVLDSVAYLVENDIIEQITRETHHAYVKAALLHGQVAGSGALRPWAELPEEHRTAQRTRARAVIIGLHQIGRLVVPVDSGAPPSVDLTEAEVELVARIEHEHWYREMVAHGWRYGATRDDGRRERPDLVPWDDTGDSVRALNRQAVLRMPGILESVGLRLVRAGGGAVA